MSTQTPSLPDPLYLALSRKLVLLILLMITTAIGLVALLLKTRSSTPWLAFLLTDVIMGLVAGFSVRWILPSKARILGICSMVIYIIGGLALLSWFTGGGYGIELLRTGRSHINWWEIGQILLATGSALLALYAWQRPARSAPPETQTNGSRKLPFFRRKPFKRPSPAPKSSPNPPDPEQTAQPSPREGAVQSIKPKRPRADHKRPKLVLSGEEQHRCPYCLEWLDKNDPRGVVECEICHTLHHADCWAITGACQVPHFNT